MATMSNEHAPGPFKSLEDLSEALILEDASNVSDKVVHALADLMPMPIPSETPADPRQAAQTIVSFFQSKIVEQWLRPEGHGAGYADGENGGENGELGGENGGQDGGGGEDLGGEVDAQMAPAAELPQSQGEELDKYASTSTPEKIKAALLSGPFLAEILQKVLGSHVAVNDTSAELWKALVLEHEGALKTFAEALARNPKSGSKSEFFSADLARKNRMNTAGSVLREASKISKSAVRDIRNRWIRRRNDAKIKDAQVIVSRSTVAVADGLWHKLGQQGQPADDSAGGVVPCARPRTFADAKALIEDQPDSSDIWIAVACKCSAFAKFQDLKELLGGHLKTEIATELVEAECWTLLEEASGDSDFTDNFKNGAGAALPSGLLDGTLEKVQPGACAVCQSGLQQDELAKANEQIQELKGKVVTLNKNLADANFKLHENGITIE